MRKVPRVAVAVEVAQGVKIARAISLAVYLISAVGLVSVLGGFLLQFAFIVPGPVAASVNPSTGVTLLWTAPGDDDRTGTAAQYDIRYAVGSLSESTWASATPISNAPLPLPSGSTQSVTVIGLTPSTTYAFGLKSRDKDGNESALLNVVTKQTEATTCTPVWSCTDWSACQTGTQVRTCIDVADPPCGSNFGQPIGQQLCSESVPVVPPAACTEQWSCTDWSACTAGRRTRACEDLNRCGTTTSEPEMSLDCGVGGELPSDPHPTYVAVAPAAGGGSQVKIMDGSSGALIARTSVYRSGYRAGLSVAGGDVRGDGTPEVAVGSGPGTSPEVTLLRLDGHRLLSFGPYPRRLQTGVNVGVGDVDGDGVADLVTAPAGNFAALVRVFRYDAGAGRFRRAYEVAALNARDRTGANLTVADLDRDGLAEIIVSQTGPVRRSRVEVYEFDPISRQLKLQRSFAPYGDRFSRGIETTAADVNGDGQREIVTAPAPGAIDVRVFMYSASGVQRFATFFAADRAFRGGIDVAAIDADRDGQDEILTVSFSDGAPGLRVFRWDSFRQVFVRSVSPYPTYAYAASYRKGVRLAAF